MKVEGSITLSVRIKSIAEKSYPTCAAYALVYEHDCFRCFDKCICNLNSRELRGAFGPYYNCIAQIYAKKVK